MPMAHNNCPNCGAIMNELGYTVGFLEATDESYPYYAWEDNPGQRHA